MFQTKTVTIGAAGTDSNAVDVEGSTQIVVYPPAVLDATTFTLQASADGVAFADVQTAGAIPADVVFAASKVLAVPGCFKAIRIEAGAAVAADRVFVIQTL